MGKDKIKIIRKENDCNDVIFIRKLSTNCVM